MAREMEVDMARHKLNSTTRRQILTGGLGILAAPFIWRQASAEDRRIVVRDAGGPFALGFAEAFYKPFQAASGIQIVAVPSASEPTSQIRAMVENGAYTWDTAHLTLSAATQLTAANFLEPLKIDTPDFNKIPAEYKTPYFAGVDVFSVVLAYRTDAFAKKGLPEPTGWADYFDVKKLPVRRGMRKHPFDNVEIALLADGVPLEKLYPLDFDRAYRKLDSLKPSIAAWWDGGAQSSQLLKSGEIDMTPAWNARAQAAIDDGAPVKIIWDQNLWVPEGFTILRGTPKADLCREFIKFTASPEQQAIFTKHLSYGPVQADAYKNIPPDRAKVLSTYPDNMRRRIQVDDAFWAANKDKQMERFNAWVLG
jgi:putative spermidine/putrescine transport system substrate-binding protein